MKERMNGVCAERSDPHCPDGTLALVLRMPIDRMPDVITKINEISGARIIYQTKSVGRLKIVPED